MNTIVKTYNDITKSLGRFFDIRRLLRNWLFSDIELHDMIYDEVYSQTSDNMSKVDDWVYEVESLEDKVNDFEYKLDDWEYSILDDIQSEAQSTLEQARKDILDLVKSEWNVQLTLIKKENE